MKLKKNFLKILRNIVLYQKIFILTVAFTFFITPCFKPLHFLAFPSDSLHFGWPSPSSLLCGKPRRGLPLRDKGR